MLLCLEKLNEINCIDVTLCSVIYISQMRCFIVFFLSSTITLFYYQSDSYLLIFQVANMPCTMLQSEQLHRNLNDDDDDDGMGVLGTGQFSARN